MDTACAFDEIVLLDYLLGEAAPEQHIAIEQSPACRAEAVRMAQQLAALYRTNCPDVAMLVAYQERRIADSTLALVVHQHAATCSHCTQELGLLAQIDGVSLEAPPSALRRLVEAVFQAPLARATAVRGDLLLYTTPKFAVHLRVRQVIGQPGTWTVRGQVRTGDGQLAVDLIQTAQARAANGDLTSATVESGGAFRFEQLSAGTLTLTLYTADEEIIIQQFSVGDEPATVL